MNLIQTINEAVSRNNKRAQAQERLNQAVLDGDQKRIDTAMDKLTKEVGGPNATIMLDIAKDAMAEHTKRTKKTIGVKEAVSNTVAKNPAQARENAKLAIVNNTPTAGPFRELSHWLGAQQATAFVAQVRAELT